MSLKDVLGVGILGVIGRWIVPVREGWVISVWILSVVEPPACDEVGRMVFSYEREMLEPAARWLRDQGLMVKTEFPTPWGICDLVGCSLNKNRVRKRLNLRQTKPIGSLLRVHLLSLIPDEPDGRGIRIEDLHRVFGGYLDKERIGHEVARLVRDHFVEPTDFGTFYKVNGWMPLHKRLVAIELKLSRVDDAFRQAINNLGFADESYVAMPAQMARRLATHKTHARFKSKGIGLLAVDPGGCEVILKAVIRGARDDLVVQEHSVERFWLPHVRGSGA